jgi:hypothetical protein
MSKNIKPTSVEHSVKYTYPKYKSGDLFVMSDNIWDEKANYFLDYPVFLYMGAGNLMTYADQHYSKPYPLPVTKQSIQITKKGVNYTTRIHPDHLTKIGEL